jgi:dihydroorotate dehydrogenase electron transfer subunit
VAHFRRWTGATPPEVFFYTRISSGTAALDQLLSGIDRFSEHVCDRSKPKPIKTLAAINAPQTSPSHQPRQKILGRVLANRSLCCEHFALDMIVPDFAPTQPGHFIQLHCRDLLTDADPQPIEWHPGQRPAFHDPDLLAQQTMLSRPFSLAGREDLPDSVRLTIIHRVVGTGTAWLSHLSPGDPISILGPLGNTFALPPDGGTALLVGGGVGIPPMLYLAQHLRNRSAIAFCGATTRDLLPLQIIADSSTTQPGLCIAEFATAGIPSIITTDDGSFGQRGYITQALEQYLDAHATNFTLYTCGPEPMMRRVAEIAMSRNIPCQVAVERAMACGMGTCQSCVIKTKTADGWRYRLSCTDGPVFSAADLLW